MRLYHNPRCSKSRQLLAALQERGAEVEVIDYQKSPLSTDDLKALLDKLGLAPRDLMRKGEAAYREQGLGAVDDPEALIAAMASTPILMERPVLVVGDRAAIGRPAEAALALLDQSPS